MNIEITGVHYHVSDATKEHIHHKAAHYGKMKNLLERIQIFITPKHEHNQENFEVHIHGKLSWHNAPVVELRRQSDNLWSAIDDAFDAMSVMLHKQKEKHSHIAHERMGIE